MPRMTQPMIDNNGQLSQSGAPRMPWSVAITGERESSYGNWTFLAEPTLGWAPYSWLVTINGHPYLVDGDTEPSDPGL